MSANYEYDPYGILDAYTKNNRTYMGTIIHKKGTANYEYDPYGILDAYTKNDRTYMGTIIHKKGTDILPPLI